MPKVSNTLLFPVVDPEAHRTALFLDAKKKGLGTLSETAYSEMLSGIWGWTQDKTKTIFADCFNSAYYYYYYYVTYRAAGAHSADGACHGSARSAALSGFKVTVPLRYWDAYSSSKNRTGFDNVPTTQILQAAQEPEKFQYAEPSGYEFNDFVRFYNWYLSDKNPMFKRFVSLMSEFEIHKTPDGYPVGFTCKVKPSASINKPTIGLFLCMSRFLSEGFEKPTTQDRRKMYHKLAGTVEDYVLYPVIEAFTTSSTSHRWFHFGKVNLDLWFSNTFSMHESYWIQSFGNETLPDNVRSYLRSKGFMK